MLKNLAIHVTGRVQHVGFRYFAVQEAGKFGVTGFVRNEPDGSVYIEAQAEEDALYAYVLALRKGPAWARVDRVQINPLPVGTCTGFKVRY